jgi:peptidoglycan/LPS O-acetylase OafA/YrhL
LSDSDDEITLRLPARVHERRGDFDYEITLKLPARIHEKYDPSGRNGASAAKNGFHAEPAMHASGPAIGVCDPMKLVTEPANVPQSGSRPRIHLDFLDALRGLAALYVAIGHSYVSMRPHLDFYSMSPTLIWCLKLTDMGHFAVALFIVLSGFCLMLPVARSADGQLRGGTAHFFRGRVRRIVPPYLAALVLSMALMALVQFMQSDASSAGVRPPPELTAGSILSHIFLVHNLFPSWCQSINGPMWSVALESQIYLFFPLLLLPLWRRKGIGWSVAAALALGLAPGLLLPQSANLSWTYPWYICLFAFGMAAASICYWQGSAMERLRSKVPWGWIAAILAVASTPVLVTRLSLCWRYLWLTDLVLGFCAAAFIIACALASARHAGNARPVVLRMLSWKPLVALGTFSYSLYLVHMPIMLLTAGLFGYTSLPPIIALVIQACLVLPAAVAFAYWFHTVAERPFIGSAKLQLSAAIGGFKNAPPVSVPPAERESA